MSIVATDYRLNNYDKRSMAIFIKVLALLSDHNPENDEVSKKEARV